MNLLYLAAGILLLFFGRKALWMFVAIVGFLLGMKFAPNLLPDQTQSVILTISIIAGLVGALLAVLLQKFAVGLAGMVAGGYIVYYLLQTNLISVGQYQWMLILAGALIGALLAGSLFDWAMLFITSACGAVLITQGLNINSSYSILFIFGLTVVGIIAQAGIKAKE
jgi:hypothetical protein